MANNQANMSSDGSSISSPTGIKKNLENPPLTRIEMRTIRELCTAVEVRLESGSELEHIDEGLQAVKEEVREIIWKRTIDGTMKKVSLEEDRLPTSPKPSLDRFQGRLKKISRQQAAQREQEEVRKILDKIKTTVVNVEANFDNLNGEKVSKINLEEVQAAVEALAAHGKKRRAATGNVGALNDSGDNEGEPETEQESETARHKRKRV